MKDGKFLSNVEIRQLFDRAGLGSVDTAKEPTTEAEEDALRDCFLQKATSILSHIPGRSEEEKQRIERAKQFTIFASTHTDTGTDFMVVRETNGMMLLRLYHNRLELLQEGAERILELLGADRVRGKLGTLSVSRGIEVYEHGLATPTIKGKVVDNRLRYALRHARKDQFLLVGAAVLATAALSLDYQGVFSEYHSLQGHVDRFTTAMITACVVSSYSIFHLMMSATPPIEWSLHYDAN
ncbi:hypothetical protein ACVME8_002035 [Bradyrhizobium diazoefficiens]